MTDVPSYESTITVAALAERLRGATRAALVTHRKPDGDALGSIVAASHVLARLGVASDALVMGEVPPELRPLAGDVPLVAVETDPPADDAHDLVWVLDTGAWSQLTPLQDWLRRDPSRVVGLDHHARGDAVAPGRVIDVAAASTTQAMLPLLDELGIELDAVLAEPLLLGLATDTGWFRFANADARAFRDAARLLEAGADKARLYAQVEENHRLARLALTARGLGSMRLLRHGAIALQVLSQEDFAATGGSVEDLTGVVNNPMVLGSVRVAILATEEGPSATKVSFRGKPASNGRPAADVNRLAQQFGGGGHVLAAGARVEAPLEETVRRIEAAVAEMPLD